MKIFLTGATGYIGSAVAHCLMRAGHEVTGLTRSRAKAEELIMSGMTAVFGDLAAPEIYRPAALACDAVIHAGFEFGPRAESVDRVATRALIDCARSSNRLRRLIYTSGVWVLGGHRGDGPCDESAALRPPEIVSWRPSHERLVLESGRGSLAAAVVRPGCVYGGCCGLYGQMLRSLFDERVIRLVGDGSNRWASVYVEDLAELYRLLIEGPPACGIYHATDGSAEMIENVADAFIEAAGGGSIEELSTLEAALSLGPLAEALAMDQWVSSEKARLELGWKPVMGSAGLNAQGLLSEWHEKAFGPVVV